jgi:hypothetical protein
MVSPSPDTSIALIRRFERLLYPREIALHGRYAFIRQDDNLDVPVRRFLPDELDRRLHGCINVARSQLERGRFREAQEAGCDFVQPRHLFLDDRQELGENLSLKMFFQIGRREAYRVEGIFRLVRDGRRHLAEGGEPLHPLLFGIRFLQFSQVVLEVLYHLVEHFHQFADLVPARFLVDDAFPAVAYLLGEGACTRPWQQPQWPSTAPSRTTGSPLAAAEPLHLPFAVLHSRRDSRLHGDHLVLQLPQVLPESGTAKAPTIPGEMIPVIM